MEYYSFSRMTLYISVWVLVTFALYFLFLASPQKGGSYRTARLTMSGTYFLFAIVSFLGYRSEEINADLMRYITLVVGCSQALLFTSTLTMLIDRSAITRHRFLFNLSLYLILSLGATVVFLFLSTGIKEVAFYVYLCYYIYLLIRCPIFFQQIYHNHISTLTDREEQKRLRWVYRSFYAALGIGFVALMRAIFMNPLGTLFFSFLLAFFYIYFGFSFINYGLKSSRQDKQQASEPEQPNPESELAETDRRNDLGANLDQWVKEKRYTEKGITINRLAKELETNRVYLSNYINTKEEKNFRNWINDLRIEEAQRLLRDHPELSVSKIAIDVGFSSVSHFGQLFAQKKGMTPQQWRKTDTFQP